MCLLSDALLQHLPSYLGFSYLGGGVSPHHALPDLQRGIAPLGPPVPAQPRLLGCGVGPPGCRPWPQAWGSSSCLPPLALGLGCGVSPPGCRPWPQRWGNSSPRHPWPRMWGSSSRPPSLTSDLGSSSRLFPRRRSLALSAAAPDLGRGVTPPGHRPLGMGSSRLLPLTSDVG